MKRLFPLLCFLGALLASGGLSHALSIPASEDTTVADKKITLTASNAGNLAVDPTHVALVYFNLDDIPKDTVVRFARLRLYLPSLKDRGVGIGVHRVTTPWNESAESAQPDYTAMTIGKIDAAKLGSRRFVTVDVTGVVQSWIRMTFINEGIALTSLAPASRDVAAASVTIAAKEGAGLGLPAQLDIELASGGTQGVQGPAGPAGPQGPKGEPGLNGKSVLSGTVAPTSTTGVVGDFYLNAATGALYGPKTTTGWGTARSLGGQKGDTGTQGLKGNTGATGPQGPKGEKGDAGQVVSIGTGAITADKLSADAIQSIVDAAVKASVEAVKPLISGTASTLPGMVSVLGGTLPSGSELKGQVVGDFQIGKTEVTWGEWKEVRDWAVNNGYSDLAGVGAGNGDNYPVTDVSWYDVAKWCNAKSEKGGQTPVYQVNGATYKTGQTVPTVKTAANGYRMPTEAEWEWAARGGRQTQGYTYSGSNDINAVGWYGDNSGWATHEVGKKAANELGLYDMSGNLWQWCWDLSSSGHAYGRVRGGSWNFYADLATVSNRGDDCDPDNRSYDLGFRLACSSGQ